MFDRDIVLEALGVICNDTVTSVQQRRSQTGTVSDFTSSAQHFSTRSAAPTELQRFTGGQTRPVASHNFFSILGGEEFPENPAIFWGNQSGAGSTGDSTFQVNNRFVKKNWDRGILIDEDELFDPRYDYDFTRVKDTQTYYRGDEKYQRPCGWQRFALKVLDKYDGNEWLGTTNRTTQSVPGEWPVSYHGTSEQGAKGIIKGVYKPGDRKVYGRGIYSTPDIKVAEGYSRSFKSKKNGKTYKVILQNRINPKYRKKCDMKDYWLVEIDDVKLSEEEKKKMVERAIRPYGLLLKEL